MTGLKMFSRKFIKVERERVDSARMELDAVSIPSFERVLNEIDTLKMVMRKDRQTKPARLRTVGK